MSDPTLPGLRIALVYDCLFPYTVGGGERWYRQLAEGLHQAGAEVTYLTRRQWHEAPELDGIRVVAVSGPSELYNQDGTRRLLPTLQFGLGLWFWLVRHRRSFDVVQTPSFPFWSVPAVRAALARTEVRVTVDWFEVWSAKFWRSYAGRLVGTVGYGVQWCCVRLSPDIVVLSASAGKRIASMSLTTAGPPVVLAGLLPSLSAVVDGTTAEQSHQPEYVLYAGRHILDKGVDLLPRTFQLISRQRPELRFVIAGDGPLRPRVTCECRELGLRDVVDIPGFVSDEQLAALIAGATCVVVPSRREGYGYMPVDAMGQGTPVVTTDFEENRAIDNIDPGRNGYIASPPTPENIADAVLSVVAAGSRLRTTTREWYRVRATSMSVDTSVSQMVRIHAAAPRALRPELGRNAPPPRTD